MKVWTSVLDVCAPSSVLVCFPCDMLGCLDGGVAEGPVLLCRCWRTWFGSGGLSTRVTMKILWPLPGLDTEMQRPGEGGVPGAAEDSVMVIPDMAVGEGVWQGEVLEALRGVWGGPGSGEEAVRWGEAVLAAGDRKSVV